MLRYTEFGSAEGGTEFTMDSAPQQGPAPSDPAAQTCLPQDIWLFAGPNAEKFFRTGPEGKGDGIPFLPCWPGFFMPLPWFLYRKMYLCATSCFIPVLVVGLHVPAFLTIIVGCLPCLLGGMGRWLYVVAARRKIAEIRDRLPSDKDARAVIAMAGGISVAGAALGATITVLGLLVVGILGRSPFH
jgi:hypothetical protein